MGLDKTQPVEFEPNYLDPKFDAFDPNIKYNEEFYLEGIDHLDIDLQRLNTSIDIWTTHSAEKMHDELEARTRMRKKT